MANINELKARAKEIQRELQEGRNTADRVGGLLFDMLDYEGGNDERYDSDITDLQDMYTEMLALYNGLTQSDIEVVEAADWPGGITPAKNKIFRVQGVSSYSDYMFKANDLDPTHAVLMATYDNATDNAPTLESSNVVKSGGVALRTFNITPAKATPSIEVDDSYVVGTSGNVRENNEFAISESILLPAYGTIQFSIDVGTTDPGNVAVLSSYDSVNDKYTPLVVNTQSGTDTYTYQSLENNASTVRISYKKGVSPIAYISNNLNSAARQTDAVPTKDSKKLVSSGSIYDNILQKFSLTWVDGCYINFNTGRQSTLVSYDSTDFIPIYGFETLTVCTSGHEQDAGVVGYAFYDSTKTYISGGSNPTSESTCIENVVSVPENACFIRFSFYNNRGADRSTCYMSGANVPSAIGKVFTSTVQPIIPTDNKYWAYAIGNILCIGDSLTSGAYYIPGHGIPEGQSIRQNYPYYLSRMLSAEVENAGFRGITTSQWYSQKLNLYTYTDYDSVIIWLGTNGGLDPDDIDTSGTNTNDYCKIIDAIQTANSELKIYLTKVFSATGPGVAKTNAAIDAIATRYGLFVINNSDLDPTSHPELHGNINNIHFGKAGNIFLANRVIDKLSTYFADNKTRCEFGMELDSRPS